MQLDEKKILTIISSIIIIINLLFMLTEDIRLLLFSSLGAAIVFCYFLWGVLMMIHEFGRIITLEVDLDLMQLAIFFSSAIFTYTLLLLTIIN